MELLKGGSRSGFSLTEERRVEELKSVGRVFVHRKSGARLLHLENDDDNKVFCASFRTPPPDNTGMPHILEHSVLCGSRKFPSKEPFVELAKGSLKTFLNAFTFPDKTMYPVASRNPKDFMNLVDVYLDAVFHPNIFARPEILMQEGWHYELEAPDGALSLKGVVYNEMRGVYSTPEAILFRKITDSLFPDSPYRFESGGDPDAIPDLTTEKFLEFHRRYYHPSNSYLFVYGDAEIGGLLEFLDREYLGRFESARIDSSIPLQRPFEGMRELDALYPVSPNEEEGERTYLSLNFVAGTSVDPVHYMAVDILENLLLETPAAPLKNALLEARVGKDVFGQCERSLLQPVLSVVVKGSEEDRKEQFRGTVFGTLSKLVEKGLDPRLVEASVNAKEFALREADYRGFPKGLVYAIKCMDSWLYDMDPFLHLAYESPLAAVRKAMGGGIFERLIESAFLRNPHCSMVTVKPRRGLAEEKSRELASRLARIKGELSSDRIEAVAEAADALRKRQAAPDDPRDLEKIPVLSLGDMKREAERLPIEVGEEEAVKVLRHDLFTSGIAYLTLLFDAGGVPQEDVQYLPILASLLGKVSTEGYSYAELSNEVNIHTGGISFSAETYGDKHDDGLFYPKIAVKSKALVKKLPDLARILAEILGRTRYDDRDRVREIVQETKSRLEMSIYDQGHLVAAGRLLSYFSPQGLYSELLSGLSFYKFISALEKNFDSEAENLLAKLRGLARGLFGRKGLVVGVTTEGKDYARFREALPALLDVLGGGGSGGAHYRWELGNRNEGLLTPGKVQYVAQGFNYRRLGHEFSGALNVLRVITSLDYLWNKVRVQGGAYGGFAHFGRNGTAYFCSYRDPNLKETLDVYGEAERYLAGFHAEKREMSKYVIGTVSGLDAPLTPSMKGEVALERHIAGIGHEDVQKARDEVLGAGIGDIRRCAGLVGDVMRRNRFCVLGSEEKLRENAGLFGDLVPVF